MAMRFTILGSGSAGNAALLVTEEARVLIDAGFSARRLAQLLAAQGESLERVDAVFLTHEHGDHAGGLDGLRRHPHLRVFANHATSRAVQAGLSWNVGWQLFETGSRFRYRDLDVETFAVPHDAQDPVAFRFTHGRADDPAYPPRTLAWLTDLGHAPVNVRQCLRDCDAIVVESNHCPQLLQADSRRPWALKQRIAGRHGHLSNEAARELLADVASPRWRYVFLTHLSRDCNTPAAVEAALAGVRATLPACAFAVVPPGVSTPWCELG
jgi:phosphoribosyl 1,2-cyclic phosphodiesterase